MAGLTDAGFVTKRLPELVTDGKAEAVTIFQDQVQPGDTVNTDDSSVIGRLVALKSPSEADLWEAAQQTYSAFDANSATGISLDNMILLSGIPARFENTYTTSQVLLGGDTGTLIEAGNVVSSPTTSEQFNVLTDVLLSVENNSGITVATVVVADSTLYSLSFTRLGITSNISYTSGIGATSATIIAGLKAVIDSTYPADLIATINVNGTLKIDLVDIFFVATWTNTSNLGVVKVLKLGDVQAVNFGPIIQPTNTITQIQTSRLGWDSVTNPVSASPGGFRETDEELRIRFRNTKFDRATGTVEAIYSALFSLDDVTQVFIDENDTGATNVNGTPEHSFLVLIEGGTSVEIARAIFENRPAGILSFGNVAVTVIDKYGYPRTIRFSRPTTVPIYIELNLTEYSSFPSDGEDQIRNALIAYVDTLSIGQDIVYSRLYTPINSVPGHEVDSLKIGITSPPTTTANIVLAFDQIAQLLPENITFI
jgi:hypothetical protein